MRPRRASSATLRLICCPHAGAGASAYARWGEQLDPSIELVCIQPPGRESRLFDPAITSIIGLANGIADAIEPLVDRPYALFGHSFGAMVAFEVARELRERNLQSPSRLFVSASVNPTAPWPHPPLRHLDDLQLALEVSRRYGGSIPAQVMESEELRRIFIPSLRADLTAIETYVHMPAAPLSCPISAFAGSSDRMAPLSSVEEWRAVTTSLFTLRVFDGGHFFVKMATRQVLDCISADLLQRRALTLPVAGNSCLSEIRIQN